MDRQVNFQYKLFSIIIGISFLIYLAGYALMLSVIRVLDITISWGSLGIVILPGIVWFILLRYCWDRVDTRRWGRRMISGSAVLVMLITLVQLASNEYYSHFNAARWLSDPESRVRMVSDLLSTRDLKGLKRHEVEEVLGAPTVSTYRDQSTQLTYRLGLERSVFSLDRSWLLLDMEQDCVIDVRITTG